MRKFERKLAENIRSDAKSFYAYVRSMSVLRVKPTCLQQQDGTNTSTPEQTCDSFNDYFSSVFTSESMESIEQPPLVFHGSEKDKLKTISITAENVKKALGKMRIDKAPGVDDM